MIARWFSALFPIERSYKPLDEYPITMLLTHEIELIKEGFVKRGGVTMVWSRVLCPDCDEELYYDARYQTQGQPPQVRGVCVHGHTYFISTPVPAEPMPA